MFFPFVVLCIFSFSNSLIMPINVMPFLQILNRRLLQLPKLTPGNMICSYSPSNFASELIHTHRNPKQFLSNNYQLFSKQYFRKEALDILHFMYSNFLGALNSSASCIDYPEVFKKQFQKVKQWHYNCQPVFEKCSAQVFYYENGLGFANQAILNYIKDKDFMDIGACNGDSAYILREKTKKRIFSYEPNPNNRKSFQETAKYFNFDSKKNILIPYGISNKNEERYIDLDCRGGSCTSQEIKKSISSTKFVTIDSEVIRNNMTLGFIKVDVEGFGLPVFRGGILSFRKYRPVFAFSVYHNCEEMFFLPNLMLTLGNYEFEFQINHGNPYGVVLDETIIFAYPSELLFDMKK